MFDEEVRPHTRRNDSRRYLPERVPRSVSQSRGKDVPPQHVDVFLAAGRAGSALRRELRARGIDPKLARLLLMFYRRFEFRPSEIDWWLNIHPSTASRWVDRAERAALVDKSYNDAIDARATYVRITEKGRVIRDEAARILETTAPHARGVKIVALGRRAVERYRDGEAGDDYGVA